jgi:hypothetical protein
VSNGNAAVGVMLTAAILTGMSQVHGGPARRHGIARHWSSPERVELGDARIPVRSVRSRVFSASRSRPRTIHREAKVEPEIEGTPEVIVGYVDPSRGRSAFHRLTKVTEGDRVKVVRHDDSVAWFKVDSVRRAVREPLERDRPAADVRRVIARERTATGRPELRLISVGGTPHRDHAPANVVVSAHLDRPTRS